MKNWKKLLAIGTSITMAISMAACGGSSKDSTKKNEKGTTISFWNSFTGSDGDMLVELVDRFNKENQDGITVEMDISPDFDSQLSTAFAANTGPTFILSSSVARFTYGDHMQDLSDIFEKTNLKKEDFIQSYLDYCSEGDMLYFVPFQVVGDYMYWNKDLFQEAGLDPETPPATWEEMKNYAQKITNENRNVYGLGISYESSYQVARILQRFGGLAVTDENGIWKANFTGNKGYEKFLTNYKELLHNGDNPVEADTDSMMSAGQIGITLGGPWVTAGLDSAGINYGISLVPQGEAGDMNPVEVIGFSVTTIASEKEKEAAYKFIEWWNKENEEGSSPALEWSLANGFPAYTYSVQEKDSYKQNEKLKVMSSTNPDAPSDFIVDTSFEGIGQIINDVIPEIMNSVAFEDTAIPEILEKAQAKTDKILEQYN